jgi:LPXTG-site transpeptidase (sortase) family protein
MARTWPSVGRQAQKPARLVGEVALAAVLLAGLALTWSDGTPDHGTVDAVVPIAMYLDPVGGYADIVHARTPFAIPAPPTEPPIPTAAPVAILIPSLNVHRPVEPVGVDRHGVMYTPQNLWDAGWYKGGPVPGAPGDAVIEGHAGYPNAPLLFGKLRQLGRGDRIVVVLADGTRQLFVVDSLKVWRAGTAPSGMGQPYGEPWLTLITCTGPFDDHYKTYADRLVVEASYAGLA